MQKTRIWLREQGLRPNPPTRNYYHPELVVLTVLAAYRLIVTYRSLQRTVVRRVDYSAALSSVQGTTEKNHESRVK